MKILLGLSLLAAAPAQAACPSGPQIGATVTVSGTITEANALAISVRGCKIVVMVDDDRWTSKCGAGKKLSATGIYQETPLPFSPVPNVTDLKSLTCGGAKLR
jgi:hypothetical protein